MKYIKFKDRETREEIYGFYFTKKYPMWVNAESFIETVAAHCGVKADCEASYRRFIFFIEYRFFVKGSLKNLKNFTKWANVERKR